jgi:hypothetical protein
VSSKAIQPNHRRLSRITTLTTSQTPTPSFSRRILPICNIVSSPSTQTGGPRSRASYLKTRIRPRSNLACSRCVVCYARACALLSLETQFERVRVFSSHWQVEGVWRSGRFRAGKSYLLQHPLDPEAVKDVVRVRSIHRKSHGLLQPIHFEQNPLTNVTSVRNATMRPSLGAMTMLMSNESKTLSNTVNSYRHMLVSLARARARSRQ